MKFFIILLLCMSLFTNVLAGNIETAKRYIRLHDYQNAITLLNKLAEQNDAEAQYQLGVMYRNGTGTKQDYALAQKWLLKACLAGHAKAQYSLANLYQSGLGVKPDIKKAEKWYGMAAKQGHSKAATQLKKLQQGTIELRNDSNPDQQLLQAAQRGSLAKVRYFIKKGADLNYKDETKSTALMYAASEGYTEITKYLLGKNIEINASNQYHETALSLAAKNNHTDSLVLLIKAGATVNTFDDSGMSPLMHAVTQDNPQAIELLIKSGADPRKHNHHQQNALILAFRTQNSQASATFSRLGIRAPASTGAVNQVDNLDKIKSLATGSETALMVAAARGQIIALKKIAKENPGSVNQKDEHGQTALSYAAKNKQTHAAEILLKAHSNPNIIHSDGSTPLHFAIRAAEPKLVELLIQHGAKVNITTGNETPLMLAAKVGSPEIISNLIKEGADALIRDKEGLTAIEYATVQSHPGIALQLYLSANSRIHDQKMKNRILQLSAKYGASTLLNRALKDGADYNSADESQMTALMLAASHGHVDSVAALIKAGANPNQANRNGNTALIMAAQRSQLKTLNSLCMTKDIDLNIRNKTGNTALIEAVLTNNLNIIKELLSHGADQTIRNKDKRNAEDIAAASGFTQARNLLLTSHKKGIFGIF